jgi:hypothetical protein
MRPILLITLALAFVRPAVAQCDGASTVDTRVVAEREPVAAASNFSLDQIADLAKRSGNAPGSAPLGFYTARVVDAVEVDVDHDVGVSCPPHIKVDLHLRLAQRRIEVGQEVVTKPCLYDVVLEHYRKKAAADDDAFAVYVGAVAQELRVTRFAGAAGRADGGLDETTRTEVQQWVKSIVDQGWEPYHGARVAAQRAVDTPDEMRRLSRACGRDA